MSHPIRLHAPGPIGCILAIAIAAAVLPLFRDPSLSPTAAALLAAAVPVCLLPACWHWRLPAAARPPLPFLPLIGLFYLAFFALPGLFIDPADWLIGAGSTGGIRFDRVSETAALVVLVGGGAMIFSFEAARRAFEGRLPPLQLPAGASVRLLHAIAWLCVIFHVGYYYVPVIRCVPSVGQGLGPIGLFGFGYLFIQAVRGRLHPAEKLAMLGGVLPAKILFHVSDGLFTSIALLLVLFLALALHFRQEFSVRGWLALGLLALAIVLIYPLKPAINAHFRTSGNVCGRDVDWANKVLGIQIVIPDETAGRHYDYYGPGSSVLINAATGVVTDADRIIKRSPTFLRYFLPVIKRISLIALLAHVEQRTPDPVPYWNGSSLVNIVTNLVPRVFWKDKPTEQLGQKFGHAYGVLVDDDMVTSWNVPWLVEIFMNFGVVGVAIGMGLLGLFLALLQGLFNRAGMGDLEIAVGGTLLLPLFYQESNVSVMTGSLLSLSVLLLAGLVLALRLGRWLWPAEPGHAAA